MILPIMTPEKFRIIAHRGASAYAPENTISAFDLAIKMGVKEIETDTQLSAEGKVVLCHDLRLDRYGYEGRVVEEMTWAELASLDMGSWFSPFLFKGEKMITLNDLFDRYAKELIYHIELKGRAGKLPEAVYRLIEAYDLHHACIITSFSYEALAAMRSISPTLRLGWLIDEVDPAALGKAEAIALFQLCPRADMVDRDSVAKARKVVSEVRAWGLAGKSTEVLKLMLKVTDAGCDGLTINWPDWLRQPTYKG